MTAIDRVGTNNDALMASALRWWRDAGVDMFVDETPRVWGAESGASDAQCHSAGEPQAGARETSRALPSTLIDFTQWLASHTSIDAFGPPRLRIAPTGPTGGIMILGDMPEADDADTLFSGDLSSMFERMLAAMGLERAGVYLATLAPARTPTGQIDTTAFDELAAIARHHVRVVAPQRLWLMGNAASRALLGMSEAEAHGRLHNINHDGVMVNAIATAHPRLMAQSPERKARAWADMQRLMAKDAE